MTLREARGALLVAALFALAALPAGAPRRTPPPPAAPDRATAGDSGRVDLNRADPAALSALPGIGPVLAERIVAHRERHGPFESLDELGAVRGIGPRLIERLRAAATTAGRPDTALR